MMGSKLMVVDDGLLIMTKNNVIGFGNYLFDGW